MKKDLNKEEEKLNEAIRRDSFNVPDAYFENLPGKVMDQINSLPDFEKASSVNPFVVTENYFDNLPGAIAARLNAKKSYPYSWLSSLQRPRVAIPIAFVMIILLAGLFFSKQRSFNNNNKMEDFTAEDLRESNLLQTIDEAMFVDVIANQNEDSVTDSYEQYLIDNNIEISQIESAL